MYQKKLRNISNLLGIVILLVWACKSPEVYKPGHPSYKIAYNVLFDEEADNYEVFCMNLDGSGKTNISQLSGVEWTYYAYNDKVFFISDRDTSHRIYFPYTMKSDGSEMKKLADIRLKDSWFSTRRNGQEIILNPHNSVDSTGFLIVGQNGDIIHKIKVNFSYFSDPAFSPDGQYIAFRGGNKKSKREEGFAEEIYMMNADGTNIRQISKYPPQDTTAEWYAYKAGPPRWHPTENFISYQSKQNGKYSLFAVTPDGERQWKLTELTQEEGWHDWSPDGRWLAIELFDPDQTQFHIGLYDWKTKEMTVLTDTTYKYQQAPVFVEAR